MPPDKPFIHFESNVLWRNKHQSVELQVNRLYDVWNLWEGRERPVAQRWKAGLLALQSIVQEASALGRRVRALGGAWSLSDIAATEDFLVNTKPLNFVKVGMLPEHLSAPLQPAAGRLVFSQCGIAVLELNQLLEQRGLALRTSGASNGQTLGGALATGTHGSAVQFGAMQEFVLGLHVVGENGAHFWIERASRPGVSDEFIALLGTTRIADDDMFLSAVVGLGSFGLVHAVLFEAEPIYNLERWVRRHDIDDVLPLLSTLDVSSLGLPGGAELPFHFEVVFNPYSAARGDKGAYVRALYKRAHGGGAMPAPRSEITTGPGDDLLSVVTALTHVAPPAIPLAVGQVINLNVPLAEGAVGTHGQTFGSTDVRGPGLSIEIGIPASRASDGLATVLEVARSEPFAGIVAFRFMKSTDALLGFTRFAPTTCTIEIPAAISPQSLKAYDLVSEGLRAKNIPRTFHWGQCFPSGYGAMHIREIYGDNVDRWLAARKKLLPTPAGRRMFSNALVERLGLAG